MKPLTVKLTRMAHGGSAIAKDKQGRTLFVPFGIPGETVRINVVSPKNGYARTEIVSMIDPSPDRIDPECPYFGSCGGCHFQHVRYERQLALKDEVVRDQLQRIGGFKKIPIRPTIPNPTPWAYRSEISLSPAGNGRLGFWSPQKRRVIPIETCPISRPALVEFLADIDLDLPGLRKLTLKIGDDQALLAALEVDGVEPPELTADFPVSVALVLPDKTAVSLVGDHFTLQHIKGRDFRVSPGCYVAPSSAGAGLVIESLLHYAALTGSETVLELNSGGGVCTAFLAEAAQSVVSVEENNDAVADAAVNLDHTQNVSYYAGRVEDVLPMLEITPQLMVVHAPSKGISKRDMAAVVQQQVPRLITIASDVATMARDGKKLRQAGFRLVEVQPIDLEPQTFHVDLIMLWERPSANK